MLPGPMSAPSMWLNARIVTLLATVTPGPKNTFGSMVTSDARACVGGQEDRGGIDHGHTRLHRSFAHPALQHGLGTGQFAARVDPGEFVLGRFDRRNRPAVGPGEGDNVGEVVFRLRIVVAHRLQPAPHLGGAAAQHAGVAQVDGAFGG